VTICYPEAVGNRLRELRLARARVAPSAFTLGALASRIGVDQSTLWRWERGTQRPTRRHVRALAREFAVSEADLGLDGELTDEHPVVAPAAEDEGR
jgi:transcriptional regulator with XRE-family HTH domain